MSLKASEEGPPALTDTVFLGGYCCSVVILAHVPLTHSITTFSVFLRVQIQPPALGSPPPSLPPSFEACYVLYTGLELRVLLLSLPSVE